MDRLSVILLCNQEDFFSGDDTKLTELDGAETIDMIVSSLGSAGHKVKILEADEKAFGVLAKRDYDIVFNISEGDKGRNRESYWPAVLEMLDVPFVGPGLQGTLLTFDKALAKKIVKHHGLDTPGFEVCYSISDLQKIEDRSADGELAYPLFVKLNNHGSSISLDTGSLVRNKGELGDKVSSLLAGYDQPVLVEEYISGREFTIGVLGDDPQIVFPPLETHISPEIGVDFIVQSLKFDQHDKRGKSFPTKEQLGSLYGELEKYARVAHNSLECRDFSRTDVRVRGGRIYFLETNCFPGLGPWSTFPLQAKQGGIAYEDMINTVLESAVDRQKIPYKVK